MTPQHMPRRPAGPIAQSAAPAVPALGWAKIAALILAILGLIMSAYLTYTHFTNTLLPGCSATGDGCVQVQGSAQAEVFGVIPVAVLGLPFFAFMIAACSPRAWRSGSPAVYWARLGAAVSGMGFVLYLLFAELVQIGQVCPYCTSVHVITFLLFTLVIAQPRTPTATRGG